MSYCVLCLVSDDLLVQNPSTFGVEADFTDYSTALPSNKIISTLVMSGCEFRCADGVCVSLSQKCDGASDCTNGYDEVNCSSKNQRNKILYNRTSL